MSDARPTFFLPGPVEGYELCHPIRSTDFEVINARINGVSRQHDWQPVKVRILNREGPANLLESDAPWLGAHALILRPRAIDSLRRLLSPNHELLPLECSQAELSVLNAPCVDVLDPATSIIDRFHGGRAMAIRRYSFRTIPAPELHAFKIPDLRVSPTIVSDVFVDCWTAAKLSGLTFTRIWPAREAE